MPDDVDRAERRRFASGTVSRAEGVDHRREGVALQPGHIDSGPSSVVGIGAESGLTHPSTEPDQAYATVETGHAVLFVSATTLLAQLGRAEAEGQLDAKLAYFAKPKLLGIDELG